MNPLDQVPPPSQRRLAVRVTKDAIRQIHGGHPWIFDRSIVSMNHDGNPGDLAVIFDADREFVAIGLYDPTSPIRIRVLHHGRPINIDDAFWAQRLDTAIERRQLVIARGDTTGYRVIHGENDGMPGLVIDRYAKTLVVKIYTTAWLPYLAAIVPLLHQRFTPDAVVLRFSRDVASPTGASQTGASQTGASPNLYGLREGTALVGALPTAPVLFRENGLVFEADVVNGQKTGHFLDQRDNRAKVRGLARDAKVLDVFACTGGFSVYAAAGGARSVHSVDLNGTALETAVRNIQHNIGIPNVAKCEHTTQTGDAFEVMQALAKQHRRFDIVIVDPPSFARKPSDLERAVHAYKRLTRLALDLTEAGGLLVQSSCSSRIHADEFFSAVHLGADSSRHRISEILRSTHAPDHPIGFPEGAYLKTIFARANKRAEFGKR